MRIVHGDDGDWKIHNMWTKDLEFLNPMGFLSDMTYSAE